MAWSCRDVDGLAATVVMVTIVLLLTFFFLVASLNELTPLFIRQVHSRIIDCCNLSARVLTNNILFLNIACSVKQIILYLSQVL